MIKNQNKSDSYKNHADFSKKFLIFGISVLIVFFEIALAKWSLFFGLSKGSKKYHSVLDLQKIQVLFFVKE